MDQLPFEIAESVLNYLDFNELIKISELSREYPINFDLAIKQRRVWNRKCLSLKSMADLKKSVKNMETVKYCTKVLIGNIDKRREIIKILRQIERIEVLSLEQVIELYDEDLEEIIEKHGKFLKHLNLKGCQFLTNYSLNEISKKCNKLVSLNISECSFSSSGLELIIQNDNLIESLKSLDISKCYLLDQSAIMPLSKLRNLHRLSLRSLEWVNSLNLPVIIQDMVLVKKVDIRNCDDFTKQSIEQVKVGRESIEILENTRLVDDSPDSIRGYLMAMINAEINEKPEDLSRDKKFLSAAFAFLESNSECIWCQYPQICGDLLRLFSFEESPPLRWFRERTISCLTSCRACIESYYGIRPKLFSSFRKIYAENTVKDFEGKIHQFDITRLQDPFRNYLQLEDKESRKKIPIKFILFEILLFPGWIFSTEIANLFEKVLEQIISSMKMIKISEKLPGVIICSVHPNNILRNWAKSVLNSDLIQNNQPSPDSTYLRINYSWDTVILLSNQLSDAEYADAMYMCLKASSFDFIKSCSNWDWTSRIFKLLKSENSIVFMEYLRLSNLLLKILNDTGDTTEFPWYKVPDSFFTISSILDNPAFSHGPHTNSDSANFVLDWIPLAIRANLSEKRFKVAHKIISDLLEFVTESRASFQWKVKVVDKFCCSLVDLINDPYLLGKICNLLLFLFDCRFSEQRTLDLNSIIVSCMKKTLTSLVRTDLMKDFGVEMEPLEGTPSSAVFDSSNYRKILFLLESEDISLEFLNSIAKEISPFIIKEEFLIESKIWNNKLELLVFIMKSAVFQLDRSKDILNFSFDLSLVLIYIYLSGFKTNSTIPTNEPIRKLIQNHPEKCLKSLTKLLTFFIKQRFKMKDNLQIPLMNILFFLKDLIGPIFKQDLEILKIYPERFDLVFKYFIGVLFQFYVEFNYLVSLPGGVAYYELSSEVSSFGITLISLIGVESFQRAFKKYLTSSQISNLFLPALANMLMNILQRSNQSKYTDQPFLVNLSAEFIILAGNLRADFESSRVDQILKVLMTSNISPQYKTSIKLGIQQYSQLSGIKLNIISEEVKKVTEPTGNRMDLGIVRKLEILEKMDDEFISKHMTSTSHSVVSTLKPSSKLGQLRQEMVREGGSTSNSAMAKKSRFTPVIVSKAPRLMTQADLIRARADSSDSEEEAVISSETFKDSVKPNVYQQPHRSVKLIDIEDEKSGNGNLITGKPILSKAILSAQMQRDWQSAQRLHRYILSLDYTALNDSNLLSDLSIQSIPDTFQTYEKYLQIFEPLLQLECRSQIIQAKDETEGRLSYFKGIIQAVSMVDDFHEVIFNFGDDAVHRIFTEQDLIVGHPMTHPATVNKEILGLVIQTSSRQKGFEVTIRFFMKSRTNDNEFQLLTRLKQSWKFAKVCNMVTNNREFLALQNLPLYSSCPRILQPKFTKPESSLKVQIDKTAELYTKAFGLNLPQASAISYALLNPNLFTLIQGPPGTGKTRTIEGFLAVLFGRPSANYSSLKCSYKRVMICAPSNAAIDEIVRRLVKSGIKDSNGRAMPLKLVRVGSVEMIHEDVKDFSIDGIVESLIQGHIASALEMLQKNQKQLADVKVQLDKLQDADLEENEEDLLDLMSTKPGTTTNLKPQNMKDLKNQLWQLKENIRKGNKFIEDSRQNLRLKVLNEAQVVCCTLSASGHEIISKIDGDFEMVIIDEACQAIELSALIPLQYGCKRVILVGDPNQLPPTVISQMAATFSYEQSLFQRLQKIDPSAVQLLSLQYRMHPEISSFPSSYFYDGRLTDGPNVLLENLRPWHNSHGGLLGPYKFFDIPGQEQFRTFASGKQGNSMMNQLEAKIAVSLIALLSNSDPSYKFNGKIGIITPYKEQRRLISRELSNRFGPNILQSVEVSTVDGYQGQEKEIIIFSCVRTGEKSSGSIGFLNDSRRLNVAITRAKCSLFLLGKSSTLIQNSLWRTLIEDCQRRSVFVPFNSTFWQEQRGLLMQNNL